MSSLGKPEKWLISMPNCLVVTRSISYPVCGFSDSLSKTENDECKTGQESLANNARQLERKIVICGWKISPHELGTR